MRTLFIDVGTEYRAALRDFLAGAEEEALRRGYEIGRRALAGGLGILEMMAMQQEALEELGHPATAATETARRAFAFLSEALAPFEMGLRGFREANATLQRLNQALESKHRSQQEAQSQMVQTEKLASLGLLVAGVAHEINNPLSFVSNNVAVMQRDVKNLVELLRIYQGADEALAAHQPEVHQRIHELAERIDLRYTLDNLEELLRRSREGLKRIQQIVLDLRNFARLDESDLHEVDLNACVESTCNIIRARGQEQQVDLIQELAPLARLTCYPAKINQVILSLLINAIDACSPGDRVTIRTVVGAQGVEIHVVDTGTGILPSHRDKIFDPFFTTKPPGQGTGLGLSISHAIVADHGGRIEVASTPGQGTHFTVHLPARPPTGRAPAPRPGEESR